MSSAAADKAPPPSKFKVFQQGFLAASIAEVVTIPLDSAKVRLQLDPMKKKYLNPFQTLALIVKEEGGPALFGGLPAGIMRAGTIYSTRLGIYETALSSVATALGRDSSNMDVKIAAAMPVTVASMLCANPWDVIKVRYQRRPDFKLYSVDPRMIAGMVKSEGFFNSLYAGFTPNLLRNMVVGTAELVGYFQSKQMLTGYGVPDGLPLHVGASLLAAASAAAFGSPMDVVATRVMQPDVVKSGISWPAYTMQMVRNEGLFSFYKGFLPNWLRLAGFNVVLWVSFEQIKKLAEEPAAA